MKYADFLNKIAKHRQQNLPFVIFSFPESDSVCGYFQKNDTLHSTETFSENGVIMAPFKFEKTAFWIPENESEVISISFQKQLFEIENIPFSEEPSEKLNHENLVFKTISTLKSNKVSKIVITREKKIPLKNFDLEAMINRLLSLYPSGFRYVWFHPKTGFWCGATPEVLLQIKEDSFSTMALAATQKQDGKTPPVWTPKEIEEQQLVTDAITTSLQRVTSVLKISNAYNQRAGSLVHLRTDITGILKNGKATIPTIASALHPTPAVCGTPQKFAKKFINENEGYDREFYTGFIGPICQDDKSSHLFVNLRCMKIEGKTAHLYAGGGITGASEPEAEWLETHNKLQTMLQVLHPFL